MSKRKIIIDQLSTDDWQEIRRIIIYIKDGKKFKVAVSSDSNQIQCYARISIMKDDEWNQVYYIPASEMQTEEGLWYRGDDKGRQGSSKNRNMPYYNKFFQKDIDTLMEIGEALIL